MALGVRYNRMKSERKRRNQKVTENITAKSTKSEIIGANYSLAYSM